MYLSHYQLSEKPFQLSPDPKFLWLGETHKEALATLRYGVLENRGLLLLVGDVGTGKTTLINGLLNSLNDDVTVATIFDPGLEKIEFFNFLANAFNMDRHYATKGDFLVHFIHFLNREHAQGRKALLIIDEAQRLTPEMLEEIRLLSNIEKQDAKLLNIFLVGQNELLDTLSAHKSRAFMHRITTNYNIRPLKNTEVEDYVRFRLKIAGTENKIFTKGAIRSVIAFSACYPRLINTICDHALLTGYVNNKSLINARIVNDCRKELEIRSIPKRGRGRHAGRPRAWKWGLWAGVPALALALAAGYYYIHIEKGARPLQKSKTSIASRQTAVQASLKQKASSTKPPRQATPSPPRPIDRKNRPVPQKVPTPAPPSQSAPPEVHQTGDKALPALASTKQPQQTEGTVPPATSAKPQPLPVPESITTINVPFDSVTLSAEDFTVVNHLADIAIQNPDIDLHIKGYTDTSGSARYNQNLSKFRAEFFKSYFIGRGIDPARIKTFGMGSQNPVASNSTLAGRQANRRVEIEFKRTP